MKTSAGFKAHRYFLTSQSETSWKLEIKGLKLAPPSKRVTLHLKGLRIVEARITSSRRQKTIEYETTRINHIKSFGQVRLHTRDLIYPGECSLELIFKSTLPVSDYDKLVGLNHKEIAQLPLREYFPCIDEHESKLEAEFKILPKSP